MFSLFAVSTAFTFLCYLAHLASLLQNIIYTLLPYFKDAHSGIVRGLEKGGPPRAAIRSETKWGW